MHDQYCVTIYIDSEQQSACASLQSACRLRHAAELLPVASPDAHTTQYVFCQIMVLTTNLVLDGEQLEHGAARFFSETSRAAEGQVRSACGFLKAVPSARVLNPA